MGDALIYAYELGDSWQHTLLLERVLLVDPPERWLPWCLDGPRSAPPEDGGGTGSYEEFLEVLANPSDEDHTAIREWASDFDPERIDRQAVNTAL